MATPTASEQQYLSWDRFAQLLETLISRLLDVHAAEPFDRVVGISRGGLPLAVPISHRLRVPLTPVEIKSYKDDRSQGEVQCETPLEVLQRCKGRVLIVDDLADSGRTSDFLLRELPRITGAAFTLATLYWKRTSTVRPDYFVEEATCWIVFPWEND